MNIYKEACKAKLRFNTSKGVLGVEALMDLGLTELDQLAVATDEKISKTKSFLNVKDPSDAVETLRLKIILDIMDDKLESAKAREEDRSRKEHNELIASIIAKKQNAALEEKNLEELLKLIK